MLETRMKGSSFAMWWVPFVIYSTLCSLHIRSTDSVCECSFHALVGLSQVWRTQGKSCMVSTLFYGVSVEKSCVMVNLMCSTSVSDSWAGRYQNGATDHNHATPGCFLQDDKLVAVHTLTKRTRQVTGKFSRGRMRAYSWSSLQFLAPRIYSRTQKCQSFNCTFEKVQNKPSCYCIKLRSDLVSLPRLHLVLQRAM